MAKRDAPGGAVQTWMAENKIRGGGGRGRHGDLGRFLLREAVDVHYGRQERGLTWSDVAQAAAAVGIVKADGQPYPAASFSTVWGRLTRAGKIGRLLGQPALSGPAVALPVKQKPTAPAQATTNEVPSSRGQDGIGGASGHQPSAPMPPATAASPGSTTRTGKAAPEKPTYTAVSMPERRKFGDR